MPSPDIPNSNPIKAIRKTIRRLAGLGKRDRHLSVAPPLALTRLSQTSAIRDARPQPFWARLIGATSPYTFQEAYPTPNGTWADLLGGRTGTAYEINDVSGLGGTHARVRYTTTGDYRFRMVMYSKPAPDCSDIPDSSLTLTVADNAGHSGHAPLTYRGSLVGGRTWRSRNARLSTDCYGILGNPPSALGPVAGIFTFTCNGSMVGLQWDFGPPCYPEYSTVMSCKVSTANPYFNSPMVVDSVSFDPLMVVFHGCIHGADLDPTHLTWTITL